MFLQIIHILTMLAFTAHAVVGCCLHHAHREDSNSKTSQHAKFSEDRTCRSLCHHHAHEEHDSRPEGSEPDPCEESSCVFFTDSVASKFDVKLTMGVPVANPAFVTEMPGLISKTRTLQTASKDPRPLAAQRLRAILHSWVV